MKILIVEDEPKVSETLQGFFAAMGHEVCASETGAGALEQVERHHPQAILLDWWLKDKVSGRDVLVQTIAKAPKTIVIVVSGFEELGPEEITALGGYALMKKPVALDQLYEMIQKAVGEGGA